MCNRFGRIFPLLLLVFVATILQAEPIREGDKIDLELRDGRTLKAVEVIKAEGESVWVRSGNSITAVKRHEIRSSKLVVPEPKHGEIAQAQPVAPTTPEPTVQSPPLPNSAGSEPTAAPPAVTEPLAQASAGSTETRSRLVPTLVFALAFAVAAAIAAALAWNAQRGKVQVFRQKYAPLIDVDAALEAKVGELEKAKAGALEKKAELDRLASELAALRHNIAVVSSEADLVACGHYKPQFEFGTSERYKEEITAVREKQREMIRDERAATCSQAWTVNGSESEGRKATKRTLRLMLRAFNGECDAIIANVSWSNIDRMSERMDKAFEAINKLGESYYCAISARYLELRRDELDLAYGYAAKVQKEKDEQRALRDQMRDEEKARREMETAIRQAALDEERAQAALEKARAEVARVTGEKEEALNEKIRKLEERLAEAHTNRERAISRAEQTRSGHVYIISNIGSFGDSVFKIGMTRRLDPYERVSELGDASVPFEFDVHGMIYTEDAPSLEGKLHARFDDRRVNLVNERKEFFGVSIDEIQAAVQQLGAAVILTKLAEAREYRETVERRRALENTQSAARVG